MIVTIDSRELDELRQKAKAWEDHVLRRLEGGYVRAQYDIDCIAVNADATRLRISEPVIISPFGKFSVQSFVGGFREFNLKSGDRVTLETETKLSIN